MRAAAWGGLVVLAWALGGCALAQLHTARTTPAGKLDVTVGEAYLSNRLIAERGGRSIENYPLHLALRLGVSERVDVGVRGILGDGLLADARVGLLAPSSPWQVSVGAGFGAGAWLGQGSGVSLTLPVVAMASWDATTALTPYLGVGWAFWWHLDRRPTEAQAGVDCAARKGHGDGVVTLLVGLAVHVAKRVSILVEYDFMTQVVDDPGDFFSMVDTHLLAAGVTF